jgi:hypothetical protein
VDPKSPHLYGYLLRVATARRGWVDIPPSTLCTGHWWFWFVASPSHMLFRIVAHSVEWFCCRHALYVFDSSSCCCYETDLGNMQVQHVYYSSSTVLLCSSLGPSPDKLIDQATCSSVFGAWYDSSVNSQGKNKTWCDLFG